MNIKFLKFLVFFMGLLIIVGIIILCIGIYYKINNLNLNKSEDNTLIIKKLLELKVSEYYINNDKIVINYENEKKKIMHIYGLDNGKLIKKIEILK
jgi:cellulose synthase/poly-beta-1,6-N-acetylglucosamine synthase-like glycosyltransferase